MSNRCEAIMNKLLKSSEESKELFATLKREDSLKNRKTTKANVFDLFNSIQAERQKRKNYLIPSMQPRFFESKRRVYSFMSRWHHFTADHEQLMS